MRLHRCGGRRPSMRWETSPRAAARVSGQIAAQAAYSAANGYVWYAAYASNLLRRRFLLYLTGGVLPENGRLHTGARDPSPPVRDSPLMLPGTVYYATRSTTWGGGRALYDPDTPGPSPGRGYLITAGQFTDVVAQEMRLEPGSWDAAFIPRTPGRRVRLGLGHYETLVCTGELDGYPVVTMAAPWKMTDVPPLAPSRSYHDLIAEGFREMKEEVNG